MFCLLFVDTQSSICILYLANGLPSYLDTLPYMDSLSLDIYALNYSISNYYYNLEFSSIKSWIYCSN